MAEIAVLIPTVGRAEKLLPLLANIHETTKTSHRVYFICEDHDSETIKTLIDKSAVVIIGKYGSCSKAMNAGFDLSIEPIVFTANDDLWFHEGWETAALAALDEDGKHVCGTNDGNGRMTCFAMARRSFIKEQSGTFDAPAQLYHPYKSQYVDTEFADYAKARGVWTEAPDSLTEHLHHEFGKADASHPNYQKAKATLGDDHATYLERKPQWEAAAASQS